MPSSPPWPQRCFSWPGAVASPIFAVLVDPRTGECCRPLHRNSLRRDWNGYRVTSIGRAALLCLLNCLLPPRAMRVPFVPWGIRGHCSNHQCHRPIPAVRLAVPAIIADGVSNRSAWPISVAGSSAYREASPRLPSAESAMTSSGANRSAAHRIPMATTIIITTRALVDNGAFLHEATTTARGSKRPSNTRYGPTKLTATCAPFCPTTASTGPRTSPWAKNSVGLLARNAQSAARAWEFISKK